MNRNIGMRRWVKVVLYSLMILVTLFALFPFLWMIFLSFKDNSSILNNPIALPTAFRFDNYAQALAKVDFIRMYANTLFVAAVAVTAQMVICFMSSFALAKLVFRPKVKNGLYLYLIAGLTISSFILLFPIYRITSNIGLRDNLCGLVLPYIATSISFNTLLMVSFLKDLPKEVDEAALIDGCNLFQLSTRVVLPMAKPVFATLIVFSTLHIMNEFPLASILIDSRKNFTLSLTASLFKGEYATNYGGTIAASVLIIVPELMFYAFFQRYIVDGITAGAVKG